MDERVFRDRREAGVLLAKALQEFSGLNDVLVFALPRGGVTVAYEIARALRAPLDVFITHKLRFPGQPELAMGALSERGSVVLNEAIVADVPKQLVDSEIRVQREEISRRVARYRGGKSIKDPTGKTVILVDDGLATGATARAAIETLKREKLKRLIVAVPVAPEDTAREFEQIVDGFVCLLRDPAFFAISPYYENFDQVSDEEVTHLLRKAWQELEPEGT